MKSCLIHDGISVGDLIPYEQWQTMTVTRHFLKLVFAVRNFHQSPKCPSVTSPCYRMGISYNKDGVGWGNSVHGVHVDEHTRLKLH